MDEPYETFYISPEGLTDEQLYFSNALHPANLEMLEEYLQKLREWIATKPFTSENPDPAEPNDSLIAFIQNEVHKVFVDKMLDHNEVYIQYWCVPTNKLVYVSCNYHFACRFLVIGNEIL